MAAPGAGSRSRRLEEELTRAAAGRRGVMLTGQTSDALIGPDGRLTRNPYWLAAWADAHGRELVVLDPQSGAHTLSRTPDQTSLRVERGPLEDMVREAVAAASDRRRPTVIFIDYCCLHMRQDTTGLLLRTLAEVPLDLPFSTGHHVLVLAFRTEPPGPLATLPGWAIIDVGLPDAAERAHILDSYESQREPIPLEGAITVAQLATNMGGLDADAHVRLVDEAYTQGGLSVERVNQLKAAEIRRMSGGSLTVDSRTRPMEDLAGLSNLKLYLDQCHAAGATPGAVLLAGPPGTGKTRAWLAVATRLGVPAIRLGQLRSRYVGDSENNWATARRVLEATAPSCVLIDEADQAGLGHRGEDLDSGVSSRLRAELWDWLNGCDEMGITVIATTNNPIGLDSASLDRLTVLPVLHPGTSEAVQIMMIEARRSGIALDPDDALTVLAGDNRLLTGRQVVRLLRRAAREAAAEGRRNRVAPTDLRFAWDDMLDVQDDAHHELMALSALMLADSRSAWPWVAAERRHDPVEIPPYVEQLLTVDGTIDPKRLRQRLDELRHSTERGW